MSNTPYRLSERAKRLTGRNKPSLFLKQQILGMLTRWSTNHYAKGLRTLSNRLVNIRITHADLAVISYLLLEFMNQETGVCLPNQGTIAERIGVSRYTVNKSIRKWRILGVLGVVRRKCFKPSTGKNFPVNTSCFYYLTKNLFKRLSHTLQSKVRFLHQFVAECKKLNPWKKPFTMPLFDTSYNTGHEIKQHSELIEHENDEKWQEKLHKAPIIEKSGLSLDDLMADFQAHCNQKRGQA